MNQKSVSIKQKSLSMNQRVCLRSGRVCLASGGECLGTQASAPDNFALSMVQTLEPFISSCFPSLVILKPETPFSSYTEYTR